MLRSIRDDTVVHQNSPEPVSCLRNANGNNPESPREATVLMKESFWRTSSLSTPYSHTELCSLSSQSRGDVMGVGIIHE